MFGILNVYKPKGKTSHDVVAILRRVLKVKQIGHTGTLDPFAEGVLPVCIGKATRLIEYLKDDKAYIGTIQLGASTTTYDTEGEVINLSEKIPSQNEIEQELKSFIGDIEQMPPIYSAIKVDGKKLYEYARSGNEAVMKKVQPRKVFIKEIKILNYDLAKRELEIYISCSKGTYIRSIANDLGEKIGTYGYLKKLVRVQAGDFRVENSIKLEELETKDNVEERLINPLYYLNYPIYEANEDELKKISHGNSFKPSEVISCGVVIVVKEKELVAVGIKENDMIKVQKVFI